MVVDVPVVQVIDKCFTSQCFTLRQFQQSPGQLEEPQISSSTSSRSVSEVGVFGPFHWHFSDSVQLDVEWSCDMTATNIAEVLKLAAKPIQYDNDEKTWLEFRFKLENYLTLVDERYVALLLDAESQPVANLPTRTEESAVTIRTLSHTLYALLATLTTVRSLRLVQRVPNRNGFEAWRQMAAKNAVKTAGRRFAMLQAVLQPGMSDNPAKFEETWKSWEHQMDIYENLSSTKLDDDVKISVVLRECPQKLRDHLLVNSQQFESNYNKLRAIIQAYLNTNKTWIVNDFRETVPMDVDYIGNSKGKGKSKARAKARTKAKAAATARARAKERARIAIKAKAKARSIAKAKAKESLATTRNATCAGKGVISHETVGHEQTTTRW